MRDGGRRGATLHGCLVFVVVLPLVATFGMYNAGKLSFHVTVAAGAAAGLLACTVRQMRTEAIAFALIAIPAFISALLAYTAAVSVGTLETVSGLLYMAGPFLFGVAAVVRARKHMPPAEEASDDAADR